MIQQIVPQLPPSREGVGGYAAALAGAFAVGAAGLVGAPISERSAAAFASQLASGAETAVVHYVNYAYGRRGCPSWLVAGLARWRGASRRRRLLSVFHEVYASGPPWRSSYWLSPFQRRLAARLLRASDATVTTLELYGRMLSGWGPRRAPEVTPVFSTVGEPALVPDSAARHPRAMLVFGGRGNRRRAYAGMRETLAAACQALDVSEILDLGPALAAPPVRIGGVPVRSLGPLPETEASACLLRSFAGFLAYPPAFLAKSTVFAAYCAHGLVPVCGWPRPSREGQDGPPFWQPGAEPRPADAAGLAARAHAWYGEHSLARQADRFCQILAEIGPGGGADPGEP